jgi:hypothetical protein
MAAVTAAIMVVITLAALITMEEVFIRAMPLVHMG